MIVAITDKPTAHLSLHTNLFRTLPAVFRLALTVLMLATVFIPRYALADVLVEPNNNFYYRNSGDCVRVQRYFVVSTKYGQASVRTAPGAVTEIKTIPDGQTVFIDSIYDHKGVLWGVILNVNNDENGWVSMNQLLVIYDAISFVDEHRDEIVPFDTAMELPLDVDEIYFYTWPGSGEVTDSLKRVNYINQDLNGIYVNQFDMAYIDDQQRVWAYSEFIYGYRKVWICLSDPDNDSIDAFCAASPPAPWPGATAPPGSGIAIPQKAYAPIIIIVVVNVVVYVSVFVMRRLGAAMDKRKKK